MQQIGGAAGGLGGLIGALTGRPGGLGGAAGVLLGGLRNVQWSTIDGQGNRMIYKLGEQLDKAFGERGSLAKLLEGAAMGSAGASLIFGSGNANFGSTIGGALGEKLGDKVLGPALEKGLGKLGGALGGPLGSILGGVAGNLIGGLFTTWKSGAAVITQSGVSTSGNSADRKNALSGLGDTLQSSLDKIAEQLNADIGKYAVSIGLGKENYRVSASGRSDVGAKNYPKKAGADLLYDGKDPVAALRIALANAIQDGAITGVRASTQALLKAGKDLESQLQKAIDFESVFKRLKAYTDPVGAAVDEVNSEFDRLGKIFKEAGASAAEYADLEKLYGLERAKAVEEATNRIAGSLRDLYDSLTVGNDALSLKDRKTAALAKYKPLEDRVKAGDATAYDDFAKAAQTLLDIERQMSGSQSDYFALVDQVTSLSKGRLDAEQAKIAAASSSDSPFSKSSVPSNDNASTVSAINAQTDAIVSQLGQLNANTVAVVKQLIANAQASGKSSPAYPFLGAGNW